MNNKQIAEKIVEKIGEYVNNMGYRHLGVPMQDEMAVLDMEIMVEKILDNPEADIEVPEYE